MSTKHGMSDSVEFQAWRNMRNRCYRKKNDNYPRYGGRGIKVCKQWRKSFANFFADVGARPEPGYTIGRIHNDGDYKPGNVEWQTRSQQNCNKSNAHMITFNGETLNVKTRAHKLGLTYYFLMNRLKRGWSAKRALTEPARSWQRRG